MAASRLTERTVRTLRLPTSGDYFTWDAQQTGLGVRVQQSGRKMYVVGFRAQGDKRFRRLTLGAVGTLSLDAARRLARRHLGDVARGEDPATARQTARKAETVAQVGQDFLADVEARRKPKTARGYRSQWGKYIVPAVGTRTVASITRADIAALHRKVAREHPVTANRVIACAGAFFTYCERQGIRSDTPVRKIERAPEASRERFLSDDEWSRLGDALRRAETAGLPPAPERKRTKGGKHVPKSADKPIPADPYAIACLRLLSLTGMRLGEALTLRWSDVDLERGILKLTTSKTGASVRLLGDAAVELLSGLSRVAGNPYVFPGRSRGAHLASVRRLWLAVRHTAKLEGVRLHDLRHSFASGAAGFGQPLLVIGKLLGHRQQATTAKYAHLTESPVRRAATETAGAIARALAGEKGTPVTPIARRRKAAR